MSEEIEVEGLGTLNKETGQSVAPLILEDPPAEEPKIEVKTEVVPAPKVEAPEGPTLKEISDQVKTLVDRMPTAPKPEPKEEPVDLEKALADFDAIAKRAEDPDEDVFELQKLAIKQQSIIQKAMAEQIKPAREVVAERQAQKELDAYFKAWGTQDHRDPLAKSFADVPAAKARTEWDEALSEALKEFEGEAAVAAARTAWRFRLKSIQDGSKAHRDEDTETRTDPIRITPPGGDIHRPTPPAKETAAQKMLRQYGAPHEHNFDG